MNRPNRPAYWQLDLLIVVMIGLMIVIMTAHLSSGWKAGAEIGWSALAIAGMSIWVRANWAALQHEEHEQRAVAERRAAPEPGQLERTIPLTPVQRQFLKVIGQTRHKDDV